MTAKFVTIREFSPQFPGTGKLWKEKEIYKIRIHLLSTVWLLLNKYGLLEMQKNTPRVTWRAYHVQAANFHDFTFIFTHKFAYYNLSFFIIHVEMGEMSSQHASYKLRLVNSKF